MSEIIAFQDSDGIRIVSDVDPLPVTVADGLGPRVKANSTSITQATDDAFALRPNAVSTTAPSRYASQAAEASKLIVNGPGVIYGLAGYNAKGSAQFIQILDAANAVPADAAIPVFAMTAATVANFSVDFGVHGMPFTQGLVVCNSSTVATKTIGSADCQFYVRYKTL